MIGDVCDEQMWSQADLTGLTHAVVNAGIGAGAAIEDTSFAEWRRVMATNLDGAFLTLKAAMGAMRGNGGAIVLTASAAGVKAEPGIAAYGASKAGVIHLARIAAKEGAAAGIRVNAIAPGYIETAMMLSGLESGALDRDLLLGRTPLGRFGRMDEVAAAAAFLLSAESSFVTGVVLRVDGGITVDGTFHADRPAASTEPR